MKKIISLITIIFIFILSFSGTLADNALVEESLDIEKAAINIINNSSDIKSVERSIKSAEDQYANMNTTRQQILNAMSKTGGNSFSLYKSYELLPYQIEYSITAANNTKENTVASVRLQAYTLYINLLKIKYSVDLQTDLVKNLQDNYNKSSINYKNGKITKNDLRLIEINLEKAKMQLNQYKRNYDSALMALNKSMGKDINTKYNSLIDNNIVPSMEIQSLESYMNKALESRAEVLNAKANIAYQNKSFEFDKLNYTTSQKDYDDYMQKAQYDLDQIQYQYDITKIDIQSEINTGYKNLLNKLKSCESAQKQCEIAKYNYETAEKSYELANITLYELENAKISYTQSQINLKNAQLDLWLYEIKMDYASGIGPGLSN